MSEPLGPEVYLLVKGLLFETLSRARADPLFNPIEFILNVALTSEAYQVGRQSLILLRKEMVDEVSWRPDSREVVKCLERALEAAVTLSAGVDGEIE